MVVTEVVNLIVKINDSAVRNIQGFGNALSMTQENFVKMNKANVTASSTGARFANALKKTFVGMRGFRMEMLSVLFFGQAMKQMFMSLLTPALQMTGIFDLMNAVLGILFLPTALMLMDKFFLPLIDVLLGLSPTTQKWLGIIAVGGVVLGTFLAVLGALVLGIGGLISVFAPVVAFIAGVVMAVGFLPLIAIIAAVIAIVAVLALAWRKNFGNIRQWAQVAIQGVKDIFNGLVEFLKGLGNILVGIFTGDWDKIKKGGIQVFQGIIDFVKGLGEVLLGILGGIGQPLFEFFFNIGKGIIEAIVSGAKAFGGAVVGGVKKVGGLIGLASGGIVTGPTPALVGESGPEAVIPLDKLGGMGSVTNNITVNASVNSSIDMDRLARMIGAEVATATDRALRR